MTLTKTFTRISLATLIALFAIAVTAKPMMAMGSDTPSQPSDDSKKKKKKDGSAIEQQDQQIAQQKFIDGYRAARGMILAGNYEAGITAMHALGRDENADVANYIGYANRKLGNYDQSKVWYEAALKADPNHARTWSYYGMWHMEQGNRLKAEDYLAKVKLICGTADCTEYKQLKDVIDGRASY